MWSVTLWGMTCDEGCLWQLLVCTLCLAGYIGLVYVTMMWWARFIFGSDARARKRELTAREGPTIPIEPRKKRRK